jgi:hypothetical protein
VRFYKDGTRATPRAIEFACWALENGTDPDRIPTTSNHVFVRNL